MQAVADRMISTGENKHIRYEGNARAWQGANRVDAQKIEIDRDRRVMEAHGKVVSQFADKAQDKASDKGGDQKAKAKAAASPLFTVVRSSDLVYTEETRVAVYWGRRSSHAPEPHCEFATIASLLEARRLGFFPRQSLRRWRGENPRVCKQLRSSRPVPEPAPRITPNIMPTESRK